MTLTLTVQSGEGASPRAIEIEGESATLGRAPDCTMVLSDGQRGISRIQARIERRENAYVLVDAGSNPTLLNDRALDGTHEALLKEGDRVGIGAYTLVVSVSGEADGRFVVDETIMTQSMPDVGADPDAWSSASSQAKPGTPEFEAPPPTPLIPDDWNGPHDAVPAGGADALFLPDPLAATPLLREPGHFRGNAGEALIDALSPGDPLRDIGARAVEKPVPFSRSFEHVSPEHAVSAIPAVPQPQPQPLSRDAEMPGLRSPNAEVASRPARSPVHEARERRKQDAEQRATPRTDHASLLDALIEGLGIEPAAVSHVEPADLAHLVGAMLREATQGTMAALRSRAMIKRETRMAMTMIEERDNNPLKFFPDADRALAQMLGARDNGYLPPQDAMRAAFRDIQAHELAMVAGMRATLAHAMERIDPGAIERSLDPPGRLDALIGNRRARLWQRFVEIWEHVARDAGDDIQRSFGEPFGRAYQAQLDALQSSKN
ncbi:FHA domain protein [Paraburkholderia sp. BL23I1N1]|uniref:type VI secretion system-associated FHA domain protein TagH n=1 Tax=Paraburkholderia sp. BL23I1N1 TaxID=1938802 RepID=UPI000E715932|nr:type VI secretion system-associated FHA domain protein TagH [Paraburkholderia sp. BL23I1N1]RKE36307.1 FHA domain protein [Paraburkholderia sp. BL23I1N1]